MKNTISYDETRKQFMLAEDPIDIDTAISLLNSDTVKWEVGASLMANKTKETREDMMKRKEYKHLVSIHTGPYCCQIRVTTSVKHVVNGLWDQIFQKIKAGDFVYAPDEENRADTLQAEIAELNKQLVIKDELIAELREDDRQLYIQANEYCEAYIALYGIIK